MKLYGENLPEGQKHSQNIFKTRTHNQETVTSIHKKNPTLLETSLSKNCGTLSSLSLKNWRDFILKK